MVEGKEDSSARGLDEPRIPVTIEEFCAAAAMGIICLITLANVVVRYFTAFSFAFTEEFSVFLMVFLTFTGAAAAFARNRHIRMTFIVDRLPAGMRRKAEHLVFTASFIMFFVLTWYGALLFWDDWEFGTTSPGIGVPQWIYSVWLPLLSLLIVLRILGRWKRFIARSPGGSP